MPHLVPKYILSLATKRDLKAMEARLTRLIVLDDSHRSESHRITKHDLKKIEKLIMTAIELLRKYAADQAAFNTRQGAALDKIVSAQGGLATDIEALVAKIAELQNSAGEVTPEDAKLIDDLETMGASMTDKAEAVATALEALDAQNPPVVPPAP